MAQTAVAMLVLLSLLGGNLEGEAIPAASAQPRPNFVVIMADDLDTASLEHMPAVNELLVHQGVTFRRFFATTPLCCPSRASILRGQYAHNHGVLRNTGQDAGFAAFHQGDLEEATLATSLDDAGYETALIGKYLNGYALAGDARAYIPPGWDFWAAGVDHAAYASFNYDLNINGDIVSYRRSEDDYITDVLSGLASQFLERAGGGGAPFFLYLTPYAPHSPAKPAPRHQGDFAGAEAPRTPAFDERRTKDKPDWVRASRHMSDARIARLDADYRRRLESLQAVDEMVAAIVDELAAQGVLDSTYILFLSDNGYFLGEHRQPRGKDAPYDAATRIPLVTRGPGIAAGSSIDQIALNIDLMPTLLDLAGLSTPGFVDGRSLAPLWLETGSDWRSAALIEGFGKETESLVGAESATPAFRALRQDHVLYVEYETGERELYNLRKDPYELDNRARTVSNKRLRAFSRRVDALASCAGAECRRLEDEAPIPLGATSGHHRGDERRRPHRDKKRKGDRRR